ncbi:MAG TPA: chromosome partitioning protein [Verrucomicrobia bacterium]|nr:MAG: chromosome partitioning protein [Lentisphaerae bacterium GWF2_57_35]HBA83051.1 chromosome partitioning protein [Verrucomicrobiota bacterium]
MKTIAFFNNKGGVGKTTLVYHLAWMFAEQGVKTLAVDLDPQANLTSMFLEEDRLVELWPDHLHPETILGAIQPILSGTGDVLSQPHVESISDVLGLIPGDLGLSRFEDKLSDAWPRCHNRDEAAFRVMTAFHRIVENAAKSSNAVLALVDVGPNLGAINRAALIASSRVVLPLAPDLFSLQGLKNLGPTLHEWRSVWSELRAKAPPMLSLPLGGMDAIGYVIMQHGLRDNRPVKAYQRWMDRIPEVYRQAVLDEDIDDVPTVVKDPYNLSLLKHYRSLMPMAMEARKPMFALRPADGAIGAHVDAVKDCFDDFLALAHRIADKAGIAV